MSKTGNAAHIVVLAGPNGAGKSTVAPELLKGALAVKEFVNADTIAQGLSGFDPDGSALEAGKVMLRRLKYLAARSENFAFETTLASRSFAPWLRDLRESGYSVHLVFLWLPSPDFAVKRVSERVVMGGHSVPEETVRRRYRSGLSNFFRLYMPIVSSWQIFDNSQTTGPRLIACGTEDSGTQVVDGDTWPLIAGRNEDA